MASASLASGGASRPMVLPGHFGPLKYANAQDLPSYPSPGLKPGDAAASAAATLGWANSAASPGSPREHQFGTPRSADALLAAGWAQRQQKPQTSPPSFWVSTAANLAFSATKTPPPAAERPELSRQNSMRAAKGAMAGARPRARSSPQTVTEKGLDQPNDAGYALSAATIAHRPSARANTISATSEAGAIPYTTMDRQMFTSNPPVKPEADEKNRAYVLHASALAMAKKMYDQQQKIIDTSTRAHARSLSFPGNDTASLASSRTEEQPPLMYNSLQEAAYRLAQERLAKLQEEHDKQRGLQEYYGAGSTPQRTRLGTIKGKLTRRRSSSDGDLLEDKRRSEQIRKQMSLLGNKLTEVDEEKRARDREALLAAAQRNVKAQMQQMDEKVQSDTGRVPQITMDDWGRKALVAAQARSAAIGHENAGKIDIGGGKLMDRAEVEKIAAQNVQPLLDEINDKAEKEQARQEEQRLDEERRKEKAEREKMREREIQEIHKKLKDQQKDDERARKAEIKQEEKNRKEEAKAIKAENKHAAEEKGKRQELPPIITGKTEADNHEQPPPDIENKRVSTVGRVRALSINFSKRHPRRKDSVDKPLSPDDNSTSPTRKVRAWLLSRFPRPRAKTTGTAPAEEHEPKDNGRGFIGGVALARLQGNNSRTPSVTGTDKGKGKENEDENLRPDSSMREMALAGRAGGGIPQPTSHDEAGESSTAAATFTPPRIIPSTPPPPQTQQTQQTPQSPQPHRPISQVSQVSQASIPASLAASLQQSVSSMTSSSISSDEDKFVEARSEPETSGSLASSSRLTPPPQVRGLRNSLVGMPGRVSPFRESRFSEIL